MQQDVTGKLVEMINSKEFADYLTCLESNKELKKPVAQIRAKLLELKSNIQQLTKAKTTNDVNKLIKLTISVLNIASKIIDIESNEKLMRYGATKCTDNLVTYTKYRNDIRKKNLETTKATMMGIAEQVKISPKKTKK
jgi:hypothetical protein